MPGRPSLQVSGHSLPWGHDLKAAGVMAARVSESPDKGPRGRGPCAQRHTPHQPGLRAPREPPPGRSARRAAPRVAGFTETAFSGRALLSAWFCTEAEAAGGCQQFHPRLQGSELPVTGFLAHCRGGSWGGASAFREAGCFLKRGVLQRGGSRAEAEWGVAGSWSSGPDCQGRVWAWTHLWLLLLGGQRRPPHLHLGDVTSCTVRSHLTAPGCPQTSRPNGVPRPGAS